MTERKHDPWQELRGIRDGDGVLEVPSTTADAETGFGHVRYALGREGQRRLLVPCGPDVSLGGRTPNGNLSTALSRYDVSGHGTLFIDLTCTNPALDPVFIELVNEIVHRINSGYGAGDAVTGTIADFRDLLRSPQATDIPEHRVVGLIGELVVLRKLVRRSPGAIMAWTGPHGQRHDFRRGGNALEVKTSVGIGATTVSISNSTQLSEPDGGSLVLVHVLIERADGGELSVSMLCSDILAAGVADTALTEALVAMGCSDPAGTEWNPSCYALEKVVGYRVDDSFPRIIPPLFPGKEMPKGITSLDYNIDLQAATDHLLSAAALDDAFQNMTS